MVKTKINWYMVNQVLFVIALGIFLAAKHHGAPYFILWPLVWGLLITTLLCHKLSQSNRISALILFEVGLTLITILSLPYSFQLEKDEYFESQMATIFIDQGKWDPSVGTGFAENYYGHNPALHLVLTFFGITTDVSPYLLTKSLFLLILRIGFVVATFLFISTLLDKKNPHLAYFATLFVLISPRLLFMTVSRRLLAAIFILFALYAIVKLHQSKRKQWLFIYVIFAAMVVLSDHSLSYFFMALLFFLSFGTMIWKKSKYTLWPEFILFCALWIVWNTLITQVLIIKELSYIADIGKFVLTQFDFSIASATEETIGAVHINHLYETLLVLLSQAAFLGLSLLGMLLYYREQSFHLVEKSIRSLFLTYSAIGLGGFVILGYLMRTSWVVLPQIGLWIFILPLAVFAVLPLVLIRKSKWMYPLLGIILVILFTGNLFMSYTPTMINRPLNHPTVFEFAETKLPAHVAGANWMTTQPKGTILGDPVSFDFYSGMYQLDYVFEGVSYYIFTADNPEQVRNLIQAPYKFGYLEHTERLYQFKYLVFNKGMLKHPSFYLGKPLNPDVYAHFEQYDIIYDNDEVRIYALL